MLGIIKEQLFNYLNWLSDRGLTHPAFMPPSSITQAEPQWAEQAFVGMHPKIALLIETQTPQLEQMPAEQKLLLGRIVKALDLEFNDLIINAISEELDHDMFDSYLDFVAGYPIEQILIFAANISWIGAESKGLGHNHDTMSPSTHKKMRYLITHSLMEMLDDSAFKAKTWQHLQSIFRKH